MRAKRAIVVIADFKKGLTIDPGDAMAQAGPKGPGISP
jgi:hypothetical protein